MFSLSLPALGQALVLLCSLTSVLPASAAPTNPDTNTESSSSAIAARAGVPWAARHGLTSAQYQSVFNSFVSSGYRLTYVSGYSYNNDARYAAIWEKSVPYAWTARHGLTSAQYQQAFDSNVAQGYRPKHVDGYAVGNMAYFAAIWDKSPAPGNGAWVARHGLTSAQYQAEVDKWVGQGFRIAHVSGYADGGQARYAALFERPSDNYAWVARHGLTSAQYQQAFNTYTSQGYRPVKVSGYVVGGVDYYAAIWDKAPSPGWVARHGLTSAQYQAEVDKWVGQGYRLTVVSAYTLGANQDRYAAIFVKG
ncbi:hypothetical protein NEMBOFW57_010900 [Staphylotrichum longicolle]|uniref:Uncharacterized protein n=1 Tax=Staphylotrichum longicolle TaxID=669026 RepID=A0AAD4ENX0_9PEZI|nr:hypothetical protein NEMBOFW57_010900 [Staphylotrichum longicolle]